MYVRFQFFRRSTIRDLLAILYNMNVYVLGSNSTHVENKNHNTRIILMI